MFITIPFFYFYFLPLLNCQYPDRLSDPNFCLMSLFNWGGIEKGQWEWLFRAWCILSAFGSIKRYFTYRWVRYFLCAGRIWDPPESGTRNTLLDWDCGPTGGNGRINPNHRRFYDLSQRSDPRSNICVRTDSLPLLWSKTFSTLRDQDIYCLINDPRSMDHNLTSLSETSYSSGNLNFGLHQLYTYHCYCRGLSVCQRPCLRTSINCHSPSFRCWRKNDGQRCVDFVRVSDR